jgi:hypothetical protein
MLPSVSIRRGSTRLLPLLRNYTSASKEVVKPTASGLEPSKAEADTGLQTAEEMRAMQAPNRSGTWTRSQQARETAMQGPRFEQMNIKDQVFIPWRWLC